MVNDLSFLSMTKFHMLTDSKDFNDLKKLFWVLKHRETSNKLSWHVFARETEQNGILKDIITIDYIHTHS